MTSDFVNRIIADPVSLNLMSQEELFGIDTETVAQFQLEVIRKRFAEVRPAIKVVDRLARDLEISSLESLTDVTPLCLPHTMYKSYAQSYVEQGRFDKLTSWLDTVTAHDLSHVDTSRCNSLESWLDALEAQTPLRPVCSSGTSGKISVFPRSTIEAPYRYRSNLICNSGFRDEQDSGLASGEVDFFCPWPVATGRHNIPASHQMFRDLLYKDRPGHGVYTLGDGHWDVDLIWMSARQRVAEARGELATLKFPAHLEARRHELAEQQARAKKNIDAFIDNLMIQHRGRRVFLSAPLLQMIPLAQECDKRGLVADWAPGSYIVTGGSGKGETIGAGQANGWHELCRKVFPLPFHEVYGMTESTGISRKCSAGNHHMPPWITLFQLDPESSKPLERRGVQTGRLALFDLLPSSFWGGSITGDRITIDWNGGCSCGRNGPIIHDTITRYGNLRDDDKITCALSPDAYERAVDFTLGTLDAND
jgi:hypothetical protein